MLPSTRFLLRASKISHRGAVRFRPRYQPPALTDFHFPRVAATPDNNCENTGDFGANRDCERQICLAQLSRW